MSFLPTDVDSSRVSRDGHNLNLSDPYSKTFSLHIHGSIGIPVKRQLWSQQDAPFLGLVEICVSFATTKQ